MVDLPSTHAKIRLKHKSVPSMRKKGNPYLDAVKISHIKGYINFNYEKEYDSEVPFEFKAGPRVWGVRQEGTPYVLHKGKKYLEVLPECDVEKPRYFQGDIEIKPEDIEPFLKKPRTDGAIIRPKDFNVEGILELEVL